MQRSWYAPGADPPWWTRPLAAMYGGIGVARRSLYRHAWLRARRLPVPVIVVGNLSVGGTGKTPLAIALVEELRRRGRNPGVVSRGYGGSARTPMLLPEDPDPLVSGDEPVFLKRRTAAPVAIGADRVRAARLLLDSGVDVIVADDGLQHYALARDVEICMIDGARRFGNGRLLPAGPLREPRSRLRTVDFVVCNGGDPRGGEVPMRLEAGAAEPLDGAAQRRPLRSFAYARVHAVAGIGNPARFFEALRTTGIDVVEHPFPDHHRYTASDLRFDDPLPVLMTEKDAVKCRAFAREGWWRVPVTARIPEAFFDAVAAKVHA